MAKCYLGELLLGRVVTWRDVTEPINPFLFFSILSIIARVDLKYVKIRANCLSLTWLAKNNSKHIEIFALTK